MALTEAQVRECLIAVGASIARLRPPAKLRKKIDYRGRIDRSTVTLVSLRPAYNDKRRIVEEPIARVRWIGTKMVWRLYWMRADLKWHSYQPMPSARTLRAALAEVHRDPYCCFFG
jgi:hypothetical protein